MGKEDGQAVKSPWKPYLYIHKLLDVWKVILIIKERMFWLEYESVKWHDIEMCHWRYGETCKLFHHCQMPTLFFNFATFSFQIEIQFSSFSSPSLQEPLSRTSSPGSFDFFGKSEDGEVSRRHILSFHSRPIASFHRGPIWWPLCQKMAR